MNKKKKSKIIKETIGYTLIIAIFSGTVLWAITMGLLEVFNIIFNLIDGKAIYLPPPLPPIQSLLLSILVIWIAFFIVFIVVKTQLSEESSEIISIDDLNENAKKQKENEEVAIEQSTLLFLELGFAKRRDIPFIYERINPDNQEEMKQSNHDSNKVRHYIYYQVYDGKLHHFELNGNRLSVKMNEAIHKLMYEKGW